jgi:urease beta subunit
VQALGGRPIILEAEIRMPASAPSLRMVLRFLLGGRHVAERFEQQQLAAGMAVRFEPGQSREVRLVAYGGARLVILIQGNLAGLRKNLARYQASTFEARCHARAFFV